jgi:hypothetical protein
VSACDQKALRRYTKFDHLLGALSTGKMHLRDTSDWEDRNDKFSIALFKEKKSVDALHALCFSKSSTKFHLWSLYGHREKGACAVLLMDHLIKEASKRSFIARDVIYETIRKLKSPNQYNIDDLPFLKRNPYSAENEFRIISIGNNIDPSLLFLPVTPYIVVRVEINPWASDAEFSNMKQKINSVPGYEATEVIQSKILSSPNWQETLRSI